MMSTPQVRKWVRHLPTSRGLPERRCRWLTLNDGVESCMGGVSSVFPLLSKLGAREAVVEVPRCPMLAGVTSG